MKIVRTILFVGLITLIAATTLVGGLIIGGFGGYHVATSTVELPAGEDAQAEYYRGVYDICYQQVRRTDFCLNTVQKISQANWYEKPSPGFEWPPTVDGKLASTQ